MSVSRRGAALSRRGRATGEDALLITASFTGLVALAMAGIAASLLVS